MPTPPALPSAERDMLLLLAILDRPDGDILNIVQAANELPGTLYDKLSAAYGEVTGTEWGLR